jgi:PKD repeat protein
MKKNFTAGIITLFLILFSNILFAQQTGKIINPKIYDQLKQAGQIKKGQNFTIQGNTNASTFRISPAIPNTQSSLCNCWIERDNSWDVVPFTIGTAPDYRNDDGSSPQVPLPFNFCFYGSTRTHVYINNNGNVTFNDPVYSFTAGGFPADSDTIMIAPFWADVDTRDLGSGIVYYQLTPTHLIIQWENVGYYASHSDKTNSFQLIMTDGNDTIIPPGDNVSFCYKDMQWTTGDVSPPGNVGGFGGIPATVGINQGNGIDYIQVGLFNQQGNVWDGPFGNTDGIDALDNQSFFFNCCFSSANIPPIIKSNAVCDTLRLCIGDTVLIDADYLSPEPGQITTSAVNTNGMNGVTVLQQTVGNIAHIQLQIIADASNLGYNTIYLIGTDDGVPAQQTSTPIVISVQPSPTAAATFVPPSPISPGTAVTFTNTSTGLFTNWDFDDGTTSTTRNPVHTFNSPGTYYVTMVSMNPNGCSDTLVLQIDVINLSADFICAVPFICPGTCTGFTNLSQNATQFLWSFPGANPSVSTDMNPTSICYNTPGSYDVQLIASDGANTDTVFIQNYIVVYPFPPPQGIMQSGDTLFANQGSPMYQWYYAGVLIPGATNYFYIATQSGNYNVVVTDNNGCEVEAVAFDVIASVNLQATNENWELSIYPDPVKSELYINGIQSAVQKEISIYNLLGEKQLSVLLDKPVVNCKALLPGMYVLEIQVGESIYHVKFLKADD